LHLTDVTAFLRITITATVLFFIHCSANLLI
jgi:hypothetical protein